MEHRWNEIDRGKPKYSGKGLPQRQLPTTNLVWNKWLEDYISFKPLFLVDSIH
jgi:hypothetical protein